MNEPLRVEQAIAEDLDALQAPTRNVGEGQAPAPPDFRALLEAAIERRADALARRAEAVQAHLAARDMELDGIEATRRLAAAKMELDAIEATLHETERAIPAYRARLSPDELRAHRIARARRRAGEVAWRRWAGPPTDELFNLKTREKTS